MSKLKNVSRCFKVFGYLCFITSVVISIQLVIAGRQFDYENQKVISAIIAFMNLLGSALISTLFIYVGKFISERRRYIFCKAVSIFICFIPPIGTAVGAYSLSVLSVEKESFSKSGLSGTDN